QDADPQGRQSKFVALSAFGILRQFGDDLWITDIQIQRQGLGRHLEWQSPFHLRLQCIKRGATEPSKTAVSRIVLAAAEIARKSCQVYIKVSSAGPRKIAERPARTGSVLAIFFVRLI